MKLKQIKPNFSEITPNKPSRLFLAEKDLNFLIIISILIVSSKVFNSIKNELIKKWSSFILSIVLILIGTEFEFKQFILSLSYGLILSILIYRFKYAIHLPSLIYIIAFFLITSFRLFFTNPISAQTNIVLMMILLRSVSLAFDIQEFSFNGRCRLKFSNIFTYLFCHCGLIIGPFYRYRVYKNWISFEAKFKSKLKTIECQNLNKQCNQMILERLPALCLMILVFLIGNIFFPLNSIKIKKSSFLKLFGQTLALFYIYRVRLYVGFILSEIICILNYFGIYPIECEAAPGHGPTIISKRTKKFSHQYTSDAIKCVSSFKDVELSGSIQQSLRNWNLTVQFWLKHFCYQRLKGNADLLRLYETLFIR